MNKHVHAETAEIRVANRAATVRERFPRAYRSWLLVLKERSGFLTHYTHVLTLSLRGALVGIFTRIKIDKPNPLRRLFSTSPLQNKPKQTQFFGFRACRKPNSSLELSLLHDRRSAIDNDGLPRDVARRRRRQEQYHALDLARPPDAA